MANPSIDFSRPVVVFGLIGQSNADGVHCRYRNVVDPGLPKVGPFPGCYIFDKFARPTRLQVNADAEVRPLTPGYASGGLTPWLDADNDFFGPEISFAHGYQQVAEQTVVLVKLAIGGSRVGLGDFMSWNVHAPLKLSLLTTYLEGYWTPTMNWLDHQAKDVRVGGVVSMVGGSDARLEDDAKAYSGHMADAIGAARKHIRTTAPTSVPWLVIKTPPIRRNGMTVGFLDQVRAGQDQLGNLENVKVQELSRPDFHVNDPIHLSERGQVSLGRQLATWALSAPH